MLTIVSVKLKERLAILSALTDLEARSDPTFPERVLVWLDETEKALQQLRRPEAATLAALRGKLLASRDGFRDSEVRGDLTPRKALRAAATIYMAQAEARLRDALQQIEAHLQPLRAQLLQLVSAGYLLGVIASRGSATHEQWLSRTWSQLGNSDKLRGVHVYLSAALPSTDRLYLLDELLTNLGEPSPHAAEERTADHGPQ